MQVLKPYRAKIDEIDRQIVELLKARFDVIHEVAGVKARENIPVILEDRIREVIDGAAARGGGHQEQIRELYTLLVTISCDLEEKLVESHSEVA